MKVTQRMIDPDTLLVKPEGLLAMEMIGSVEERITPLLAHPAKAVVIDLSLVPHITGVGIRFLYQILEALSAKKKKLVICHVSLELRQLFDSIDLPDHIPVVSTEKAAIDFLHAQQAL